MKRNFLILLIVSALFTSNAYAQFGGGGSEWRKKKDEQIEKVFAKLDLTPEQKERLSANKKKNQEMRERLSGEVKTHMQALGEELKKEPLDTAKVKALHAKAKDIRNQMSDARLDSILEVRGILTPEQFAEFTRLIEEERKD